MLYLGNGVQVIASRIVSPVCDLAEDYFQSSVNNGRISRAGYIILPEAPVIVALAIRRDISIALHRCRVLQKLVGDRHSAVIIDESSPFYGFIAADMRHVTIGYDMPFMVARPFRLGLSHWNQGNLSGKLTPSKTPRMNDPNISVDDRWHSIFTGFQDKSSNACTAIHNDFR